MPTLRPGRGPRRYAAVCALLPACAVVGASVPLASVRGKAVGAVSLAWDGQVYAAFGNGKMRHLCLACEQRRRAERDGT